MDDRPCLFAVAHGAGSLLCYFNSPRRIEQTLRFPLADGAGSVTVLVGPDRRPSGLQVLNAWSASGDARQLDVHDQRLKWELYEMAVELVQLSGGGAAAVKDTIANVVRLAQQAVQASGSVTFDLCRL